MSEFADPEAVVYAALNAAYVVAGTPPTAIKTSFPTEAVAKGTYRLQIDFEGDSGDDYPVTARSTVRVVAWTNKGDRDLVKEQAGRVRDLLGSSVVADVAGFVPSGLSAVAEDPDTGNLSCFVRVRADLLATPVAS